MKLIYFGILAISFISCSTPLSELWDDEENAQQRNKKLITEDFKVEEEVLNQFAEQKVEKPVKAIPAEKIEKKKQKPAKKKAAKVTRKVIKPKLPQKPLLKAKVPVVVKSPYPQDFPEKLKDFDKGSVKFWHEFSPFLFVGEETTLSLTYMGISTGDITITTKPHTRLGETDVYHFHARVKTSSYYSYLYELDDVVDSYVKMDDFIPLKFSLIQRESSQNIDDLQLFDLKALKTYTFYKRVTKDKNKKKKKVANIPLYFQDPFSIVYYIRGLPMDKGGKYRIPIINQGKVEFMLVEFVGKEQLKTKIGKKEAYKVKIISKHKGKTIEGGNMTFWFSADERRIFLKFKAKIKIGSISGEISKYKE